MLVGNCDRIWDDFWIDDLDGGTRWKEVRRGGSFLWLGPAMAAINKLERMLREDREPSGVFRKR